MTAADLGKYLRQLAAINRDPKLGNPALSEALAELSEILLHIKSISRDEIVGRLSGQHRLELGGSVEFQTLSLDAVREMLRQDNYSKGDLLTLSSERFGMAKSRLDKLSREEIVKAITAAAEHEESLKIISNEAKRGGQLRSS